MIAYFRRHFFPHRTNLRNSCLIVVDNLKLSENKAFNERYQTKMVQHNTLLLVWFTNNETLLGQTDFIIERDFDRLRKRTLATNAIYFYDKDGYLYVLNKKLLDLRMMESMYDIINIVYFVKVFEFIDDRDLVVNLFYNVEDVSITTNKRAIKYLENMDALEYSYEYNLWMVYFKNKAETKSLNDIRYVYNNSKWDSFKFKFNLFYCFNNLSYLLEFQSFEEVRKYWLLLHNEKLRNVFENNSLNVENTKIKKK